MGYESSCDSTYSATDTSRYEGNCDNHTDSPASETYSNAFGEFYSVGIDSGMGLKQKIEYVHGPNSQQVGFIGELEDFLSHGEKYQQATKKFTGYLKRHAHTHNNLDELIDELVNTGYIKALERLSYPSSCKDLNYYKDYAATYGMTLPQAVLFGPNGTARQALKEYQKTEMLRGQHRGTYRSENHEIAKMYDQAAVNTKALPEFANEHGDYEPVDIADDRGKLPVGIESTIEQVFGREKALCQTNRYKGTKRLPGDLPYQILESMAIELLSKQNGSKLEGIIEHANRNGKDAFSELYHHPKANKKTLENTWNDARKILNDYAFGLWKKRNGFKRECVKIVEKKLPGTIYLNGSRYYWNPKHGEANIPLVPEKDKNKLPGCLSKHTTGGYYWLMTHLKFRRKLVPDGQKTATKDLKTARKLQLKEWEKIQKHEPQLAEKLKNIKMWGKATKHKPTAVKVAKKLWTQMKEDDPDKAARILSNKRPDISQPDVDKVWPGWTEQKERLTLQDNKSQLPIVYPRQGLREEWKYGLRAPEKLEGIVDKMKDVNWIKDYTMLVFDDNSPTAPEKLAIQSNGENWTNKYDPNKHRYRIRGSASTDKDSERIRFTVYQPGFELPETLLEEVYHAVFEIIQHASPKTFNAVEKWYRKNINNGSDVTLNLSEAFSQAMTEEEFGHKSTLPRSVVKHAQKIFSKKNNVSSEVMGKVKGN